MGQRREEGDEEAGDQAEDGRDGRGRGSEDVGRDAAQREGGVEEEDHRLTGELGRDRDSDDECQRCGEDAAEDARERSREDEQAGGGEHGEDEAVAAREPGVDGQQHDDAEAEERQPAGDAAEGEAGEGRRGHHAGAEDARLGGDQNHEADQGDEGSADADRPGCSGEPEQSEHDPDDDRAVRPGDGGQVAERTDLHVVVEFGKDVGRVADGESGEEPAARAGEFRRDGSEPVAQLVGRRQQRGRRAPQVDRAPGEQEPRPVVPGFGCAETARDAKRLAEPDCGLGAGGVLGAGGSGSVAGSVREDEDRDA